MSRLPEQNIQIFREPFVDQVRQKMYRLSELVGGNLAENGKLVGLNEYNSDFSRKNDFFEQNSVVDAVLEEGDNAHLIMIGKLRSYPPQRDLFVIQTFTMLEELLIRGMNYADVANYRISLRELAKEAEESQIYKNVSINSKNEVVVRGLIPESDRRGEQEDVVIMAIGKPHNFIQPILPIDTEISLSEFYIKADAEFDKNLSWQASRQSRGEAIGETVTVENAVFEALRKWYIIYLVNNSAVSDSCRKFLQSADMKQINEMLFFMSHINSSDDSNFTRYNEFINRVKKSTPYPSLGGYYIDVQNESNYINDLNAIRKTHDITKNTISMPGLIWREISGESTKKEEGPLRAYPFAAEKTFSKIYGTTGGELTLDEDDLLDSIFSQLDKGTFMSGQFFKDVFTRGKDVNIKVVTIFYPLEASIIFFSPTPGVWGISMYIARHEEGKEKVISDSFEKQHLSSINLLSLEGTTIEEV